MKKIIKVKNLKRTYDNGIIKTRALKGVSFDVKKGEFISIMGPSGSGKSTLLHQLGLLDEPTAGKIFIDSKNIMSLNEKQKNQYRLEKLGYVFQSYNLIPELTALENVYLTAMARGITREKCKSMGKTMLKEVGLEKRENYYPAELSGGEQQRVSLARALVNKPKILFADEPTANLDSDSSKNVINLLKKLNKEIDQTIVMVTHEEREGKQAERIIWLKDGLMDKSKTG